MSLYPTLFRLFAQRGMTLPHSTIKAQLKCSFSEVSCKSPSQNKLLLPCATTALCPGLHQSIQTILFSVWVKLLGGKICDLFLSQKLDWWVFEEEQCNSIINLTCPLPGGWSIPLFLLQYPYLLICPSSSSSFKD